MLAEREQHPAHALEGGQRAEHEREMVVPVQVHRERAYRRLGHVGIGAHQRVELLDTQRMQQRLFQAAHCHLVHVRIAQVERADQVAAGPQARDHGAPARALVFRQRLAFAEDSHAGGGVALAPDDFSLAVAALTAFRQHQIAMFLRNGGE